MWTMSNLTSSLQIELKVTAMNQIVDHLKYSWKVKVLLNLSNLIQIEFKLLAIKEMQMNFYCSCKFEVSWKSYMLQWYVFLHVVSLVSVSVRCPLHPETFENNAWQAWILAKICFARYVFWLLRYFRLLLMILSYTVVCNLVMKHWSRGKDKYNCIQVKRKVSFDKLWQPGEGSLCKRTDTRWIFCKKFLLS